MLGVEIVGPHQAIIGERPVPQARGDVVKVEILVAPICTEWQGWRPLDQGVQS